MAAQSSIKLNKSKPFSLEKLWQTAVAPVEAIQGEDRRKATTLSALLVVFAPLALITIFLTPILNWFRGEGFALPSPATLAALVIILSAYAISRTKYYKIGAYLTVAVPIIAVGGVSVLSETPVSDVALFFLTLSIILGSLVLDARGTLIAGILASLVVVAAQMRWMEEREFSTAVLMFMIISTGLLALVSQIREGYVVSLEQARARAERSDQVKSAFLASMSHELRTPLNAIINFTRYVAKGSLGTVNEQQAETLNEVVDSARHLLNLINDVLDMSKIEAGSLNLFVEDNVNLYPILNSVATTGKALIGEKPIEISVEIKDELPAVRADRQRILQILLNIMSNACKFTEKGTIKIQAHRNDNEVIFSITDSGPGIAPEDQAAVFEAFKQTNTGLRQGSGTGLGMPISKSLAEAHCGRLWLESSTHQGATFYVAIPVKSDQLKPSLVA